MGPTSTQNNALKLSNIYTNSLMQLPVHSHMNSNTDMKQPPRGKSLPKNVIA